MRFNRLFLLSAAAAIALSACSGAGALTAPASPTTHPAPTSDAVPLAPPSPPTGIAGGTLLDEKAEGGFEAFAIATRTAVVAAKRAGVITPGSAVAVQIADLDVELQFWLEEARTAQRLSQSTMLDAHVATVRTLARRIRSLIPTR